VGNAGSRCGEPWTPGPSRRGPAQAFRRSQLCTCAGQRTGAAISGALSTRPQRRRRRWPDQEVAHRVTPCGLSNRARRTPPFVAGVASATVANVGGRCIQATRDRWFPESGLAHTGAVHGACGSVLLRVAPALAWTLNKYTPAKGV